MHDWSTGISQPYASGAIARDSVYIVLCLSLLQVYLVANICVFFEEDGKLILEFKSLGPGLIEEFYRASTKNVPLAVAGAVTVGSTTLSNTPIDCICIKAFSQIIILQVACFKMARTREPTGNSCRDITGRVYWKEKRNHQRE